MKNVLMMVLFLVGCNVDPLNNLPDGGVDGNDGSSVGWPVMPGMPAYAWTPLNCTDSIINKELGTVEILTRGTPCFFQHRKISISDIPDSSQVQIQLFNEPPPTGQRLHATVSAYLVMDDWPDYHDAPKVTLGSWNEDQAFHVEFKKPMGAQKFAPVFQITVAPNSAPYIIDGFYIFEYKP
jgi:hypothetical protein